LKCDSIVGLPDSKRIINSEEDPVSCSGGVFSGRWLGFRESVR